MGGQRPAAGPSTAAPGFMEQARRRLVEACELAPGPEALAPHFDVALARAARLTDLGVEEGVVIALMRADDLGTSELHEQVATLANATREAPGGAGLLVLVYHDGCPPERLEALRTPGRFGLLAHLRGRVLLLDLAAGRLELLAVTGDTDPAEGQVASSAVPCVVRALEDLIRQRAGAGAGGSTRAQEVAFARRLQRVPLITMGLLVANLAAWWGLEAAGGSTIPPVLSRLGAQVNALVLEGQHWRLVTACFLHIGALHLAFNALALFLLGRTCENLFGRGQFIFLYLVSGIAGGVATLIFLDQEITSAGASGAIFGLLGAQLVFGLRWRHQIPGRLKRTFLVIAISWTAFAVFTGLGMGLQLKSVNNAAHLGGLLGGVLCALLLRPRILAPVGDALRASKRTGLVLGLLAVAVLGASLVMGGRHALREGARVLEVGKGRLFYTAPVTAGEARRLGDYLSKQGLFKEESLLDVHREGAVYTLWMPVKQGATRDQDLLYHLQTLVHALSEEVFSGAPVRVDLGDPAHPEPRQIELRPKLRPAFGVPIEDAADKEATLAAYEEAARLYPESATAQNNLAWGYAQLNRRLDRALELAQQAVKRKPHAEFLDTLAYVQLRRGKYDEAEEQIRLAIKKAPKRKIFRERLRQIRAARGDARPR